MVTTEGDWDGLRMTNLKKLASFFKLRYPWRIAPLKHAFIPGFCAERMFIQNDILTNKSFIYLLLSPKWINTVRGFEGDKTGLRPNRHQPLITHPIHQRFTTPAGLTSPTLFTETAVGGLLCVSNWRRQSDPWRQWKCCETGHMVFPPYLRRLESLTICRSKTKAAHSTQLF